MCGSRAESVCGMVGGCDQARSVCLCVCACVRRYLPGCVCSCICCFLWWWAMGWIQRTSVYFIFHKGLKTTTYTRKASYTFPAEKNLLRFNQHAFAGWLSNLRKLKVCSHQKRCEYMHHVTFSRLIARCFLQH